MRLLYIFPFSENSHSISKYGLESTGVHMEYQGDRQDLTIMIALVLNSKSFKCSVDIALSK